MAAPFETLRTREVKETGSRGQAFVFLFCSESSNPFVFANPHSAVTDIQRGDPVSPPGGLLIVVMRHQQTLGLAPEQSPPGKPKAGAASLSIFLPPLLQEDRGVVYFKLLLTAARRYLHLPLLPPPAPDAVPPPAIAILSSVHFLLFILRLFAPEASVKASPEFVGGFSGCLR